ncbi:hypothetical protein HanPI659440_Chr03g0103871 [Helianthus annuus]|nr:hypothetical protein HanPI659440_Chr03g0103871 [Helianthus annuus]
MKATVIAAKAATTTNATMMMVVAGISTLHSSNGGPQRSALPIFRKQKYVMINTTEETYAYKPKAGDVCYACKRTE